jgi:hypothetical protein
MYTIDAATGARRPCTSQVLRRSDAVDVERALPVWQQNHDWQRIYSLQEHGCDVRTFIDRVRGSSPTLVVLSTEHGEICGAYASEAWHSATAFCGDGDTFLFSCGGRATKREGQRGERPFRAFRWCAARCAAPPSAGTNVGLVARAPLSLAHPPLPSARRSGANDSFVLSTSDESRYGSTVSFGTGGENFGLHFGASFQGCSTAPCATFANAPLIERSANDFSPVHVEAFMLTEQRY